MAFQASVFPSAGTMPRPAPPPNEDSIHETVARIDASFENLWRERQLTPAPLAPPLAVARRMSLALQGTIPSLEEIRRLEGPTSDDRMSSRFAELWADRRTADYLAERYARAFVGVDGGPFLLFRRRRFVSWLADRLAANEPYDRLVRHLIADSGLWTDTPATNFVTVAIQPDQGNELDANQLTARTCRAFLAIRIDCAECHNHPFEPWKQTDFQHLAAFYGQTQRSLRGIRDVDGAYRVENRRTGQTEMIACEVPFAGDLLPSTGSPRQRLAVWVTHHENRAFARAAVNLAWALLFGRPLVEPIDSLPASGTYPAALDILADDFVAHGYNLRRLLETIAASKPFRLDSKTVDARPADADSPAWPEAAWAEFPLTRLRAEQIVGALLQSASLSTIDSSSHILVRLARTFRQRDFVSRYGDPGSDEFDARGGTVPQRLLMMNGQIVQEKTKDDLLSNAATQIAALAPDDAAAVETSMLTVLTRRPSEEEKQYFTHRLDGTQRGERIRRLGDLFWTLLNSTEFSWNH